MRILIAGDYCPHDRVIPLLEESDYRSIFGEVRDIALDADYAIVNMECPIVEHPASPIDKCGPNLKCSSKGLDALKWAQFHCVTLANNHFYDYGENGVQDTLAALCDRAIDYVGGGKNLSEASSVLYKQIGSKTLALINCCEHEFSIATEVAGGANPLNPIKQFYAIQEAKKRADYVLVIVHGGFEHYQLPSQRMKEAYRFFVDAGADAVINHHQHCYSGYEVYEGKPIFYGLGNFCFDWEGKRNAAWNEGFMVRLTLEDGVDFEIIPYIQCDEKPAVKLLTDRQPFDRTLGELNAVIADDGRLGAANQEYLRKCIPNYAFCFEPFYNRLTKGLLEKGVLPSFIRRRRLALIDFLTNESHYEKMVMTINEAFK